MIFNFVKFMATKKSMTTIFCHPSLLLLFLDPGSEIRDPESGMGKNQDRGETSPIRNTAIRTGYTVVLTCLAAVKPSLWTSHTRSASCHAFSSLICSSDLACMRENGGVREEQI
jgi:hypothetical protein